MKHNKKVGRMFFLTNYILYTYIIMDNKDIQTQTNNDNKSKILKR